MMQKSGLCQYLLNGGKRKPGDIKLTFISVKCALTSACSCAISVQSLVLLIIHHGGGDAILRHPPSEHFEAFVL